MLPPIDSVTANANPKFEALYRDLCTSKLNADGTTKLDARASKEHESVVEELHKARAATAKRDLIKSNLSSLAYKDNELPSELRELVGIIAAALENPLTGEDADLLQDDIQNFRNNLPVIIPLLRKAYEQDLTTLTQLTSAHPGPVAHGSQDLPSWIRATKHRIATDTAQLHGSRLELAHALAATHALARSAAETSIRILEQTIHGSVARGSRAQADYLATVAEGMSKKLQLQHQQLLASTQSPDMEAALEAKTRDLEREGNVLRRRVRETEERLEAYRGAGAVRGLAGEYADILGEIERAEIEVRRLEKRR